MSIDDAEDSADAVLKFSLGVGDSAPARLLVHLDARAGMPGLCKVEAALSERWPQTSAREFVWLPRCANAVEDRLHLRAFSEAGEVICDNIYRLERCDV